MNLVSVIFFILAAILYFAHEKYPFLRTVQQNEMVVVTAVHDGDTVSVVINKKQEKVRLIGIDAPELAQRPWGEAAKGYLASLLGVGGWKVRIEQDVERTDQYGRVLAYLWTADNMLINLEMIKNGYAMLYTVPPNVKYVEEFRKAQSDAREKRMGIWGDDGLKESPQDHRNKHPRL